MEQRVYKASPPPKVEISDDLMKELETLPLTDFTRQQLSAIRQDYDVSVKLKQELAAAKTELAKKQAKIPPISDKKLRAADSTKLQQEISDLAAALQKWPRRGEVSTVHAAAREALTECLIQNKDRPLNCQAHFSRFCDTINSTR